MPIMTSSRECSQFELLQKHDLMLHITILSTIMMLLMEMTGFMVRIEKENMQI